MVSDAAADRVFVDDQRDRGHGDQENQQAFHV
jgi:hypothetical protein